MTLKVTLRWALYVLAHVLRVRGYDNANANTATANHLLSIPIFSIKIPNNHNNGNIVLALVMQL